MQIEESFHVHYSYASINNPPRSLHKHHTKNASSPKTLHKTKSYLMYAFSNPSNNPFSSLHHRIIRPTALSSHSIPTLQVLSDLIFGQSILSRPIGTGRPGPEFVPSIFALAEYFFHIQRPWLSKYRGRVHRLLSSQLCPKSWRISPAWGIEILVSRIFVL